MTPTEIAAIQKLKEVCGRHQVGWAVEYNDGPGNYEVSLYAFGPKRTTRPHSLEIAVDLACEELEMNPR